VRCQSQRAIGGAATRRRIRPFTTILRGPELSHCKDKRGRGCFFITILSKKKGSTFNVSTSFVLSRHFLRLKRAHAKLSCREEEPVGMGHARVVKAVIEKPFVSLLCHEDNRSFPMIRRWWIMLTELERDDGLALSEGIYDVRVLRGSHRSGRRSN
jgi:hypothetical protein